MREAAGATPSSCQGDHMIATVTEACMLPAPLTAKLGAEQHVSHDNLTSKHSAGASSPQTACDI